MTTVQVNFIKVLYRAEFFIFIDSKISQIKYC